MSIWIFNLLLRPCLLKYNGGTKRGFNFHKNRGGLLFKSGGAQSVDNWKSFHNKEIGRSKE